MFRYSPVILSAALLACGDDLRVAEIRPPEGSTSVKVIQGATAPDAQLSFSLQRPKYDDSWAKPIERQLKAVGLEACGADQAWSTVRPKGSPPEAKPERKVRFYE